MKKILLIAACVGLFFLSMVFSVAVACRVFLKDMVEVHGTSLFGDPVQVNSVSVDWLQKNIVLQNVCVLGPVSGTVKESTPLYCSDSVSLSLPSEFSLAWQANGLLPDFLQIDLIDIQALSVVYDIDSVGGNLRDLRARLSGMSAAAMKDRLDNGAKSRVKASLLHIREVKVSGITVNANSQKNPARSRAFSVKDMVLPDVGGQGAVSSEVAGQIVRAIADKVDAEAISQGIVPVMPTSQARPRHQSPDDDQAAQGEESSAGKAVRSIGEGFKKAGSGLWQGTKKLFD